MVQLSLLGREDVEVHRLRVPDDAVVDAQAGDVPDAHGHVGGVPLLNHLPEGEP